MKFNYVLAIGSMFVDVTSEFIYNYSDLFVILVSIGLSTRFKQIADEMMIVKGQVFTEKLKTHFFLKINLLICYSTCQ